MRYAKLSCTEFYPCYLQQCHSMELFSYWTPGHGQNWVIWIRSVLLLFRGFHETGSLVFFQELNMVLGTHVVLCMTGFFECIGKFSFFSQFFLVYQCDVHRSPLSVGGGRRLSLQPNFQNGWRGGLDRTLTFRGRLLGKRRVTIFSGRGVAIVT